MKKKIFFILILLVGYILFDYHNISTTKILSSDNSKISFKYTPFNSNNGEIAFKKYNGTTYLEIVADDNKEIGIHYALDKKSIRNYILAFRFLSHAGFGEVRLNVKKNDKSYIYGFVVFPPKNVGKNYEVLENSFTPNYVGADKYIRLIDFLKSKGFNPDEIDEVDITISVSNGQHLILLVNGDFNSSSSISHDYSNFKYHSIYFANYPENVSKKERKEKTTNLDIKLNLSDIQKGKNILKVGDNFKLIAYVKNTSTISINNIQLTLKEPYAYGVIITYGETYNKFIDELKPGEIKRVEWKLKANRSDEVNFGKPWPVEVIAESDKYYAQSQIPITIIDDREGKIFYVMTEDLEPIDSAGYVVKWGNRNSWLDPQEFNIQLVEKPQTLNEIANKYGAKWTHFIAYPVIDGAKWVADNLVTNVDDKKIWHETLDRVIASMIDGIKEGHQYILHPHMDYCPQLPWNYISYDLKTNGFWANHNLHGWAHSLLPILKVNDIDTRMGAIAFYQGQLNKLYGTYYGQPMTLRMGSFDFGEKGKDTQLSTTALQSLGIYASSDARESQKKIYFADASDINKEANNFNDIGMVELSVNESKILSYNSMNLQMLNSRFRTLFLEDEKNGKIKPGVHLILGFTHAMFMMGDSNWESTIGGHFTTLNDHLKWVTENYIKKGKVKFATADEAVAAYLDYYTPRAIGIYGKEEKISDKVFQYPLRILGQDIPFDENHVQEVLASYPIQFLGHIKYIKIYNHNNLVTIIHHFDDNSSLFTFKLQQKTDNIYMRVYSK
ncbi:hypothetical protein [Thermoanaerobacter sp. YS13]|uniref:hypothetical protein n=1 Tax=Thermoanaerobacter sp. YS13 TaxID=1511746 RepID=UPI00068DB0A4|nr:hypothetical protein [Thermoanaerobacter sp. YS13]